MMLIFTFKIDPTPGMLLGSIDTGALTVMLLGGRLG
jgi:hypothetical protein